VGNVVLSSETGEGDETFSLTGFVVVPPTANPWRDVFTR
jgi:hypothetical protein